MRQHHAAWNEKLSALSEGFDVSRVVHERAFVTATKIAPGPRAAGDYVILVRALSELREMFPELDVRISDDGNINHKTALEEIDLHRLHADVISEWGDTDGRAYL